MGCDFNYSGNLPFPELQEKVIQFVISYYSKPAVDLLICPRERSQFITKIVPSFRERRRGKKERIENPYPNLSPK